MRFGGEGGETGFFDNGRGLGQQQGYGGNGFAQTFRILLGYGKRDAEGMKPLYQDTAVVQHIVFVVQGGEEAFLDVDNQTQGVFGSHKYSFRAKWRVCSIIAKAGVSVMAAAVANVLSVGTGCKAGGDKRRCGKIVQYGFGQI